MLTVLLTRALKSCSIISKTARGSPSTPTRWMTSSSERNAAQASGSRLPGGCCWIATSAVGGSNGHFQSSHTVKPGRLTHVGIRSENFFWAQWILSDVAAGLFSPIIFFCLKDSGLGPAPQRYSLKK